jgi:predicted exporter
MLLIMGLVIMIAFIELWLLAKQSDRIDELTATLEQQESDAEDSRFTSSLGHNKVSRLLLRVQEDLQHAADISKRHSIRLNKEAQAKENTCSSSNTE